MKIALISDIHANLPALEVVLKDIDQKKPDAVYCLGDLVGYNIWPNEVIDLMREKNIPTLAGNHDFDVARLTDVHEETFCFSGGSNGKLNRDFTNFLLTKERKEYLFNLPSDIRFEQNDGRSTLKFLLVHGSPRSVNEYLLEDHDREDFVQLLLENDAHVMAFGHSHKPFDKVIDASRNAKLNDYRHVFNTGSVGKPKDGDVRACYVMLNVIPNPNPKLSHRYMVMPEFVRLDYDVEKAAKAVEASVLPDEFADMLRKAY